VLQEAANELHDIEGQDSGALTVGLAVTNEDRAVLESNDARIGNGDFENVGCEIFESSLAGGDCLAVDVPVDVPELGWDLIQQFGLRHQIAELSSKDFRESFDGEEEIDSGGMPRAIR